MATVLKKADVNCERLKGTMHHSTCIGRQAHNAGIQQLYSIANGSRMNVKEYVACKDCPQGQEIAKEYKITLPGTM